MTYKFNFAQYVLENTAETLVNLDIERITANTVAGTVYSYKGGRYVSSEAVEFPVSIDADRNEQYIEVNGKTVYASAYYK